MSRLVRREADAQFYAMAVHKIIFVDALLRVGLDVLFLDADISLLCNPLPLLARSSTSATTRPRTASGRRDTAALISFTFSRTTEPP